MENKILSESMKQFISERCKLKLEALDKKNNIIRKKISDPNKLEAFEIKIKEEQQKIEENFIPTTWISKAAKKAKQIAIVTHVSKFREPSKKGSSIYDDNIDTMSDTYLTTNTLKSPTFDFVCSAGALDVVKFLELSDEKGSLINYIEHNNSFPFESFCSSSEQLNIWMNSFFEIFNFEKTSTNAWAAKLYFPINETEYHLICPLFSSTLAHEIYKKITDSRYSEEAKEARKAKRFQKKSAHQIIDYLNVAIQRFGGTQPQNVSRLNSTRKGKAYIINSSPPSF